MSDLEKSRIKKIMDKALIFFGKRNFYIVYDFFLNLIVGEKYKNYKYIVFKTRRAFVLFEIFLCFFEHDFAMKKAKSFKETYRSQLSKIYNDSAFGYVDFSTGGKSTEVLFVDDILIHGRTLSQLVKKYSSKVAIIYKKIEAECVETELVKALPEKTIKVEEFQNTTDKNEFIPIECSSTEWKYHSNNFVHLIQISGFCYSTFAPQYKASLSDNIKSLKIYKPSGVAIEYFSGLKSSYYYEENKSSIFCFLREYEYFSEETLIVPFVILPTYKLTEWKESCNAFFENLLKEKYINEKERDILVAIFNNSLEQNYEYSYRLISYMLSELFLMSLFTVDEKNSENFKKINSEFLFSTFGIEIAQIINNLCEKFKLIEVDFSKWCSYFNNYIQVDDVAELKGEENTVFYASYQDMDLLQPKEVVKKYIIALHELNENKAFGSHTLRCLGLSGVFMAEKIYKDNIKYKYEYLGEFINKWDSGEASYIPVKTKMKIKDKFEYVIGGNMVDGEQAYHERLSVKCVPALNCFYEFYRSCENTQNALERFNQFIEFNSKNTSLDLKYFYIVDEYVRNNNSILELKNIYCETIMSDYLSACIKNFRKHCKGS